MTADDFNEAAELYDNFALYDREGVIALVGQLVLHLAENQLIDLDPFIGRLAKPENNNVDALLDASDQVTPRFKELAMYLSHRANRA